MFIIKSEALDQIDTANETALKALDFSGPDDDGEYCGSAIVLLTGFDNHEIEFHWKYSSDGFLIESDSVKGNFAIESESGQLLAGQMSRIALRNFLLYSAWENEAREQLKHNRPLPSLS